eukprot:TRINITY_DN22967_c0_g1_i1.p1 TRINITY_DN22967_c0_g1~~TRINITY_DN22967_c0_g1_i1.p1  ORF type:complete len:299 (+),score=53.49 TRINITY_DN22967_c0_g1_i1:71-967(+)
MAVTVNDLTPLDLYNYLAACPAATAVFIPTAEAPVPPDGGWICGATAAPDGLLGGEPGKGNDGSAGTAAWIDFLNDLEIRGLLDGPLCFYTGDVDIALETFRSALDAPEIFEEVISLREVHVLSDASFREFRDRFGAWLCAPPGARAFPPLEPAPSHLRGVQPNLYLGDRDAAASAKALKALSISHVLNCTPDLEDCDHCPEVTFMRLPLIDLPDEDLAGSLDEACAFLSRALEAEDGRCLVHCHVGVSRSASVCIAYAMQKHGLDYAAALDAVRQDRWCVRPNDGFVAQLRRWRPRA